MSGSRRRPSSRTKTKIDHVVPLTPALRFEPQAWHPYGAQPPSGADRQGDSRTQRPVLRRTAHLPVERWVEPTPDAQRGRLSFGKLVNGVVKLSPQRCDDGELVIVEGVVKGLAAIDCGVSGVAAATLGK